ncbi:hypothetical protein B0H10DRAFT_2226415 [Mycena sp. CBHHK59/15]|nr:hypothetical protein B0H10DRAFT_2226415 [Mycena sp. CBHHK59/15]
MLSISEQKTQQHQSVAKTYAAEKKLDPNVLRDLMHEEHMSDEASWPEDEGQESFSNWKRRMAKASGHRDLAPAALAELKFVEVLEADWRTTESQVYSGAWYGTPFIAHTKIAPFNFGISKPWLEKHRFDPRYQALLSDWDTYPDPVGFGFSPDDVNSGGGSSTGGTSQDTVGERHESAHDGGLFIARDDAPYRDPLTPLDPRLDPRFTSENLNADEFAAGSSQ